MNFWKRYPADYQRKTARLTLAQHGAYTLLLDELYTLESSLPSDLGELFRICRAMNKTEQDAVRVVADRFFPINGDGQRHNKRADEELDEAAPAIEAARENGKKGGRPKKKPSGLSDVPPNENPVGFQNITQKEPSSKAPQISDLREEKEKETTEPSVLVDRSALNGHGYRVPDCPYDELLALFHEQLPTLPHIVVFNASRKTSLRARWVEVCAAEKFDRDAGLEWFRDLFRMLGRSEFLTGKNGKWKASFDWLLQPKSFAKAVEGNYQGQRQ